MSSLLSDPRQVVRDLVQAVTPLDEIEASHRREILEWIDSGAQLFRTAKPATPPRHLAVYAALLDQAAGTIMLIDHVKAQAWLMPGGHVDPDEDPRATVVRELEEELKISPPFHPRFGAEPLFVTVTQTRGTGTHTDVTLWFVFAADQEQEIVPDPDEFSQTRWLSLDDPQAWTGETDPHLHRFLAKLALSLDPARSR